MSEQYTRLCADDRKVIENMNKGGYRQIDIAAAIGFSQSTVSKELSRNRGQRGYRFRQAEGFSSQRRRDKPTRPRVIVGDMKREVDSRLRIKHSPDQISGKLAKLGMNVSHETVYRYVIADKKSGGVLWKNLRINGTRRYRRRVKAGRGEKIPNRTDIDERSKEVNDRERYGDFEADLIQGAGQSGYILSIYERKSHVGLLFKLEDKGSKSTATGLVKLLRKFDVKTITYDNGLEFASHEFVNELLGSSSYFCKPYSSWEKGGVENYNGLVRQYFEKKMNFRGLTQSMVETVAEEINNRPRKTLGYACPNDFLDELKVA